MTLKPLRIIATPTQGSYTKLMIKLEQQGWKWAGGYVPTDRDVWHIFRENTCIFLKEHGLVYGNVNYSYAKYPNIKVEPAHTFKNLEEVLY